MPIAISEQFRRLQAQSRCALIPFITAGDPDLPTTAQALETLAHAGADIIELGVPYSDPLADGPVIQAAATRALQRGTNLPQVLELVQTISKQITAPIVLFSYYNPILNRGVEPFLKDIAQAGGRGLVVPDLPLEEAPSPFAQALHSRGVPVIDQRVAAEWQPEMLPKLIHILRQGNYDIVHTHLLYADLYGGLAARCLPGVKVLCTRHNDNRYRQRWPMRPLITWNTRCFHHVIAISEHIKRFNQYYQRVPEDKITVIPYGYDPPVREAPIPPKPSGTLTLGILQK